jgi:transcriptional regulator with XRE-family HTH domain
VPLASRSKSIHSPDYQVLLRLLREARQSAGVSQTQVAEQLGYQTSAVSKMERGELRLDLLQVRDYCRAIGLPLRELVERFETAVSERAETDGAELA